MKQYRFFIFILLFLAAPLFGACEKKAPVEGAPGAAGGVFADVIDAVKAEMEKAPDPAFRDDDVKRFEERLITAAKTDLFVPINETEYSQYYDEQADESGKTTLDTIIDAEWEKYLSLINAVSSPESAAPDAGAGARISESLTGFCADLPGLIDEVKSTPDCVKGKVNTIIALRYQNIILREGVDPRVFVTGK